MRSLQMESGRRLGSPPRGPGRRETGMHVLIADWSVPIVIAALLEAGGSTVSLPGDEPAERLDAAILGMASITGDGSVRALSARLAGVPLVLATHVPIAGAAIEDLIAFRLFSAIEEPPEGGPPRPTPRLVPGTTLGPAVGRPLTTGRALTEVLRKVGVRVSLRADMTGWLTSTAAWLTPVNGAVVAAAEQGSDLLAAPDLVTLAARAGQERIRVLRRAGLPLESRARWLDALPESLAILAVRHLAQSTRAGSRPSWLPSVGETVAASRLFASLCSMTGLSTPAADFLDSFAFDGAAQEARILSRDLSVARQ